MQSLLAAQQLLTTANSGLSAAQQQQLLASMSSSLSQVRTSTISTIIYHIICVFCLALHPAAAAAPGQLDGRGGRHGLHVGDGVQVRTSDMFDLICPTCLILSVLHV